jgi:hypothetical protein
MSDREAFEKWSIENGYDVTRGKYPNYTYNTTQQRWEGFKAGLQHPQPAVPEVPKLTGKQWAAMRAVIHEYAGKINVANHFEVRSAHLDAAPEAVYQALLSAAKGGE